MDLLHHYLQIVFLGIVEGVTEFLPISSTGHLLIAESWLGVQEPDVFNVVIQAGAILAVVFVYWHKIMDLIGSLDKPESRSYLLKLLAAFVITCVLGYVAVDKYKLKLPESLTPVAWATLIGGLIIFAIEFLAKNLYAHEDVSWPEAILIGAAQILAGIFPGTSRSGATIMTGLAMGMKRTVATQFSFLVGIPTMFAASAHELVKYRKDLTTGDHQILIDIALGFIVSLVVAFFVIKWLLRFVQSHTFNGFALYRVLLGAGLLIAIAINPALAQIGNDEPESKRVPKTEAVTPPPVPTPSATNTDNTSIFLMVTNTETQPATPTTNISTGEVPSAGTSTNSPSAPDATVPASSTTPNTPTSSTNSVTQPAPENVPAPQN